MSTLLGFAKAAEVKINSIPNKADVYIINATTLQKKFVAQTPLEMNYDDFVGAHGKDNTFQIVVEKKGFAPNKVLVLNNAKNNIELLLSLEVSQEFKQIKRVDQLITQLFEVQRLVRSKDYNNSLDMLGGLVKEYPHYSSVYELKGGIHYLRNEFSESLSHYRKAFDINPENFEAFKMKDYLENRLGKKKK